MIGPLSDSLKDFIIQKLYDYFATLTLTLDLEETLRLSLHPKGAFSCCIQTKLKEILDDYSEEKTLIPLSEPLPVRMRCLRVPKDLSTTLPLRPGFASTSLRKKRSSNTANQNDDPVIKRRQKIRTIEAYDTEIEPPKSIGGEENYTISFGAFSVTHAAIRLEICPKNGKLPYFTEEKRFGLTFKGTSSRELSKKRKLLIKEKLYAYLSTIDFDFTKGHNFKQALSKLYEPSIMDHIRKIILDKTIVEKQRTASIFTPPSSPPQTDDAELNFS